MPPVECCCYFYPIRHKFGQVEQRPTISNELKLNRSAAKPGAGIEEIELKCYNLSEDRLLVETDRRFRLQDPRGLIRSRPIGHLDEARNLLDSHRPASCSLIRLKVEPSSGHLEKRLSIVEVLNTQTGHLDEVGLSEGPAAASEPDLSLAPGGHRNISTFTELTSSEVNLIERKRQRQEQIAERLSSRSFMLVERNTSGAINWVYNPKGVCRAFDANKKHADELEESWRSVNSITVINQPKQQGHSELVESTKLRDDFLSSIELAPPSSHDKVNEDGLMGGGPASVDKSKMKISTRIKKSVKRKLNKMFSGSSLTNIAKHAQLIRSSKQSKYSIFCKHRNQNNEQSSQQDGNDYHNNEQERCHDDGWQLVERSSAELARFQAPETRALGRKALAMISYNHNEAHQYARGLHAALESQGISTYLDVFEIREGADWQDSLNLAIIDCRLFIPLITPAYGETLWTRRELKLADLLGKLIIPINFLEPSEWPPKSLAIQFATIQYIPWMANSAGHSSGGALGQSWPVDCIESIARQIRQTIQVDLLGDLKIVDKDQLGSESTRSSCSGSSSLSATTCSSFSSSVAPQLRANRPHDVQADSGYDSLETTGLLVARKSVRLPLLRLDGPAVGQLPSGQSNYYGSLPEGPTSSQASCSPNGPLPTGKEPQVDFARAGKKAARAPKSPEVARRKNSIGRAFTKFKRTFKSK